MVIALSIIAFLLVFYKLLTLVRSTESLELLMPLANSGDWQVLVHRVHNAYLVWRPSPLTNFFSPQFYLEANIVFFSSGLFLFFFLQKPSIIALVLSSLFSLLTLVLFGLDLVLISSMAWVPFLLCLLWSFEKVFEEREKLFYFLLILVSSLLASSSNSLSAFLILTCFVSAVFCKKELPSLTFPISFFIALFYNYLWVKKAPFPEYPKLSRVVSDDGLEGVFSPILGQSYSHQVIDFSVVSEIFASFSLLLTVISCAFLFGFYRSKNKFDKSLLLSLTFALLSLFETYPDRAVSINFPLSLISKLLPNAFLFPLAGFTLFFSLLFLLNGLYNNVKVSRLTFYQSILLVFIYFLGNRSFNLGLLQLPVFDNNLVLLNEAKLESQALVPAEVLISPSYVLLKEEGFHVLESAKIIDILSFENLQKDILESFSNNENEEGSSNMSSRLTVDGDLKTTWDSGSSLQKGGEFLAYKFRNKIKFDAIWLNLGGLHTDFPRGLKLSIDKSCSTKSFSAFDYNRAKLEGERVIYNSKVWQGVVRLTKDSYPYYGSQGEIKLVFPKDIEAECLYIEQIGKHPSFTWTVAEVLLHRTDRILDY